MISVTDAMTAAAFRESPPAVAPCWAVGTLGPGSAGASTLAVALATQVDGLLVEADADGGVLGARYGAWLNERAPSLASLLAALHTQADTAVVEDHLQRLPGGARAVLVAPDVEGALGPVRRLAEHLGELRQRLAGETLVIDIGRVRPDCPSLLLAEQADALVAVVRPDVESLGCLLARLGVLLVQIPRLVVVVRGDGPYALADIRAAVKLRTNVPIPVVAVPEDPRGVKSLSEASKARRSSWGAGRTDVLMQSVRALATVLNKSASEEQSPIRVGRDPSRRRSSSPALLPDAELTRGRVIRDD